MLSSVAGLFWPLSIRLSSFVTGQEGDEILCLKQILGFHPPSAQTGRQQGIIRRFSMSH
jgi:hypothetical protein